MPVVFRKSEKLDFRLDILRHNPNHSNWNLANILAWKTSFITSLSYFIHLWKRFYLKLALNLSDPQAPHITAIFQNFLQTILFYVNKSACYIYWLWFVNLEGHLTLYRYMHFCYYLHENKVICIKPVITLIFIGSKI